MTWPPIRLYILARCPPENLTVGTGKACPGPPSHDSKVSIPCSCSVLTNWAIPESRMPSTMITGSSVGEQTEDPMGRDNSMKTLPADSLV